MRYPASEKLEIIRLIEQWDCQTFCAEAVCVIE